MAEHLWLWKETDVVLGGDVWGCDRCGVTFRVHLGGYRPEVYLPKPGLSDDCDVETVRKVLES